MLSSWVLGSLLLLGVYAQDEVRLPGDLLLGFGASCYQIEGAWNEDGKGENVWDRLIHTHPERIFDGTNADLAEDSYHRYKEDVQNLKNLGAQAYRMSLSWSRILPTGDVDVINQLGIEYYNNVINELLANGIEPMITIFVWDLPQPLQDLGGWPNPILEDYFAEFARVAFKNFGDRVKWWITFNEPLQTCHFSYGVEEGMAPSIPSHGVGEYLCGHTLLKAHAKAYHIYNDEFRASQNGSVGIVLNGGWVEPLTGSNGDAEASEALLQFELGWFAHPIFSDEGDYPAVMRRNIDANSKAEGRPRSRLPIFTPEEVEYIKGTADFLGYNHYSSELATLATSPIGDDPSWDRDSGVAGSLDPSWPGSASDWLKVVPWGLRKMLNWMKVAYNNVPVVITENGFSDHGELEDMNRINYFNEYLHELVKAIDDGCNVKGYMAWSLMDNFEWLRGYSERFGIYHIDITTPNRTRTPKASVAFWQHITSTRVLPPLNSTRRNDDPMTN